MGRDSTIGAEDEIGVEVDVPVKAMSVTRMPLPSIRM
jgi:hypothetical protein